MNGEDWATLIIIAILAVILSTISKWWATLVFALGFKIALLVVAMIIVILVVSLIALMCASPGWFDRVFNMANNNLNKIAKSAVDNMGYLLNQAANTAGHAFAKLFVPILAIGAVIMFVGVRNEKISEKFTLGGINFRRDSQVLFVSEANSLIRQLKTDASLPTLKKVQNTIKTQMVGAINVLAKPGSDYLKVEEGKGTDTRRFLALLSKLSESKTDLDFNDCKIIIDDIKPLVVEDFNENLINATLVISVDGYYECCSLEHYSMAAAILEEGSTKTKLYNPPIVWDVLKPVRVGGRPSVDGVINNFRTEDNAQLKITQASEQLKAHILDKYVNAIPLYEPDVKVKNNYSMHAEILSLLYHQRKATSAHVTIKNSELPVGEITIKELLGQLCLEQ